MDYILRYTVVNGTSPKLGAIIDFIECSKKQEATSLSEVEIMEMKKVIVSSIYENQETLLHIAVRMGNEGVIKELLKYRIDVDAQNNEGDTALHIAVQKNSPKIVSLLLQNKADRTILNKEGKTVYTIATELGNEKLCKVLLQTGFFRLPIAEDFSINYVRQEIKNRFKDDLKTRGGLRHALLNVMGIFEESLSERMVKIAVIGMHGAGKSSLINALIGRPVAIIQSTTDTTKFPQEYIDGNIIYMDFPGFGTKNYLYDNFEQQFCWFSYDLVIVVNKDRINDEFARCISKAIITNELGNVIFVKSRSDDMEGITDDVAALKIKKAAHIENIKDAISKQLRRILIEQYREITSIRRIFKQQKDADGEFFRAKAYADREISRFEGVVRIEENRNMFFVYTPEDPIKARIQELKDFITAFCTSERIQEIRRQRNEDIFSEIKLDFEKRYEECQSMIRKQFYIATGSFLLRTVGTIGGIITINPFVIIGSAIGGLGFSTLVDSSMETDVNGKINDKLGSPKLSTKEYESKRAMFKIVNPIQSILQAYEEYGEYKKTKESAKKVLEKEKSLRDKIVDSEYGLHKLLIEEDPNDSLARTQLMKYIEDFSNTPNFMRCLGEAFEMVDPIDVSVKDRNGKTLFMYAVKSKELLYGLLMRNLFIDGRYDTNPENYFKDLLQVDDEGKDVLIHAVLANNMSSIIHIVNCFKDIKRRIELLGINADVGVYIRNILKLKDKSGINTLSHSIKNDVKIAKYFLGYYTESVKVSEIEEKEFQSNTMINLLTLNLSKATKEREKAGILEKSDIELQIEHDIQKVQEEIRQAIMLSQRQIFTSTAILDYINECDKEGKTPLIYAITETDDVDFIKLLLEKGADINKFDRRGKTPLMYALEKGNEDIIFTILERSPRNLSKRDSSGKSIKDYIRQDASQELRNAINESLETIGVRERQIG